MKQAYVFIVRKGDEIVGTQSWFYENDAVAREEAKNYLPMYKADSVTVYYFDDGCEEFVKDVVVTSARRDIKWKDVYNAQNMLGSPFHYCQEVAENVGYKYLLFNERVYSVNGTLNDELCEEKDLIV